MKEPDPDPDFVVFGEGVEWAVAIDTDHPQFQFAVSEISEAGRRVVAHEDEFRDAAVAAAQLAASTIAASAPGAVPDLVDDIHWLCQWALESGGIGGLVKADNGRFAHVEVQGGRPVVLDVWDDFYNAVSVILSPEWDPLV